MSALSCQAFSEGLSPPLFAAKSRRAETQLLGLGAAPSEQASLCETRASSTKITFVVPMSVFLGPDVLSTRAAASICSDGSSRRMPLLFEVGQLVQQLIILLIPPSFHSLLCQNAPQLQFPEHWWVCCLGSPFWLVLKDSQMECQLIGGPIPIQKTHRYRINLAKGEEHPSFCSQADLKDNTGWCAVLKGAIGYVR